MGSEVAVQVGKEVNYVRETFFVGYEQDEWFVRICDHFKATIEIRQVRGHILDDPNR